MTGMGIVWDLPAALESKRPANRKERAMPAINCPNDSCPSPDVWAMYKCEHCPPENPTEYEEPANGPDPDGKADPAACPTCQTMNVPYKHKCKECNTEW